MNPETEQISVAEMAARVIQCLQMLRPCIKDNTKLWNVSRACVMYLSVIEYITHACKAAKAANVTKLGSIWRSKIEALEAHLETIPEYITKAANINTKDLVGS